jgi:hypothetical protein
MEGVQSLRGDELVHWINYFNLQCYPQKLSPFIFDQYVHCSHKVFPLFCSVVVMFSEKKKHYRIYLSVRKMSSLRLFNKCRYHTLCTRDTVTEVLEKIEREMKDEHIIAIS